jgi:hypothetical protein
MEIAEKIQSLPPELQQEIFDFIDFIMIRYTQNNKVKPEKKKNLALEGSPMTPKELKERIKKSEKDIKDNKLLTVKDARKKVKAWK